MQKAKHLGFTLIELMIVVAVIGILAAVVTPAYTRFVLKGNRTAAQAQMMDIADREQQFLLANRAYANRDALQTSGYSLPTELRSKYSYDIELGTATIPSYVIKFTAIGGQVSDGDLTLDNSGKKTPADKW